MQLLSRYWAAEMGAPATERDSLNYLVRALWRGEVRTDGGPTRLDLLRIIFAMRAEMPALEFVASAPASVIEEHADGSCTVDLTLYLPVGGGDPDRWTETSCAPAFDVLSRADFDGYAGISIRAAVASLQITRASFAEFLRSAQHPPVRFWRPPAEAVARKKKDVAADALLINRLKSAVRAAETMWRSKPHLSINDLAKALCPASARARCHGFTMETVRKILRGRYRPMQDRGINGPKKPAG